MLVLMAWATSLSAQITREQANKIVWEHVQNEATSPYLLYVYNHAPSAEEFMITTYNEEIVKVKYACWVYYLNENPEVSEPCQHRYLFVKEDNGNLLEIITTNDLSPDLTDWMVVPPLSVMDGERNNIPLLYPNPTTGELRIPNIPRWRGQGVEESQIKSIEVFDIYGKTLSSHHLIPSSSHHLIPSSSHHLIPSSSHHHINISHLPAGVYFVKITTETNTQTQKIIKL